MVFIIGIKNYKRKSNKEWWSCLFDTDPCRLIILRCKGIHFKPRRKDNIVLMDAIINTQVHIHMLLIILLKLYKLRI